MSDYDVVVVGSGVAGLTAAVNLAGVRRVAVVTAAELGAGSTRWAQGGLAAAVGPDDDPRHHASDTDTAGAGLCDPGAVAALTEGAPGGLELLTSIGAAFDRDIDGALSLTREGGHHRRRVAHAGGDASGAEVSRRLVAAVQGGAVDLIEQATVTDLLVAPGRVCGVRVSRGVGDRVEHGELSARAVVLATGGVGGLYAATTNPPEVTGDGVGLGMRAGATAVDLEFVQFHPTGLAAGGTGQIPLITEAVRGEGAVLVDVRGRRIMTGVHPLADLAPRDVVARRIDAVIAETGGVWLDATGLGAETLAVRFPTVAAICRRHGLDPVCDPIPVAPVQHFSCGGLRTDRSGATDVAGLYAVGEVAASGVHGANRLASNSLVEGVVFGQRLADRLRDELPGSDSGPAALWLESPDVDRAASSVMRSVMSRWVGIRRTETELAAAADALVDCARPTSGAASRSLGNAWLTARAIVAAAAVRRESRGCHWRSDYPAQSEWWRRRIALRLDDRGSPVVIGDEPIRRIA